MEIWKDIPNYEGLYQISNYGNIKNIKRNRIKKLTINKDGYYITKLSKNNKKKIYLIHRLVADTFLIKNNYKSHKNENNININELVVNHKHENKLNNHVENLEWCTTKYNVLYSSNLQKGKTKKELINYLIKNNIDKKMIDDILNIIFL